MQVSQAFSSLLRSSFTPCLATVLAGLARLRMGATPASDQQPSPDAQQIRSDGPVPALEGTQKAMGRISRKAREKLKDFLREEVAPPYMTKLT